MPVKNILAAVAFAASALAAHDVLADPRPQPRSVTPKEWDMAQKVRARLEAMEIQLEAGADFKTAQQQFLGDITAAEGRAFLEAEFGIADDVDQVTFTGVDTKDVAHFQSRSGDDPRPCDQVADYVDETNRRAEVNKDGLYGVAVQNAADLASLVTKGQSFTQQHMIVRANLIRYMIRTREAMFAADEMCAFTKKARASGVEIKPLDFVNIKEERIEP